jgi:hypothetical protein
VNLMSIDNAASRKGAIGSSEEFLISKTKFALAPTVQAAISANGRVLC